MVDLISYRLGRGSLEAAKQALSKIMPDSEILLYIEGGDELLEYELAKWKRRMLVRELAGMDPKTEPPVSMRPLLVRAFLRRRKLLVSDEELLRELEGGFAGGEA